MIRDYCGVAQPLRLELDASGERRRQTLVAALLSEPSTRLTNVDALRYCACAFLSIALLTKIQNRRQMKDVSGMTEMYSPQVFLPHNRQTEGGAAWR
jgi:hypothetical protein